MTSEDKAPDPRLTTWYLWSRYCVIGLYMVAALWGTLQLLFPNDARVYVLTVLMFALLATSWAIYDAKSRGTTILPILQMLYFLVWPVGATVYLVSRSGWRGIVIAVAHGTGLTLSMWLTFYVTFYSLHYAGVLDPQYYQ